MDSFKGSLKAQQACEAVVQGINNALQRQVETVIIPASDGGEGLLESCAPFISHQIDIQATNPVQQHITTCYGIEKDNQTAIIETARIIGLPLISKALQNPWTTTSYGVGEIMVNALKQGCRNLFIGLGGSSTNDAGLGMLQALGYRFYDSQGNIITEKMCGGLLSCVAKIDNTQAYPPLHEAQITILCDVNNPLYGENGAAYTFAPQKGADKNMVEKLDKGLEHIGKLMEQITGKHIAQMNGAGAAGGLGAAFLAFMNAKQKSGIEYVLEKLHFCHHLNNADLVITGEGSSDTQTLMGKVPQGVLKMASKQHIPVILISGSVAHVEELNQGGFQGVFSIIQEPISLSEAMKTDTAINNLRTTAEQICRVRFSC